MAETTLHYNELTVDVPVSSYSRAGENCTWGIDTNLSGVIIQSEDITEERSTDTTYNQKGAVVSEYDYDRHWTLTFSCITSDPKKLPIVGDITFKYRAAVEDDTNSRDTTWKVKSVAYNGSYNDKKKYTVTCERWANWPVSDLTAHNPIIGSAT